jgi:hypothetical protein
MQSYSFDAHEHMYTFDAEAHVYAVDGRPVPSVTQVLGAVGLAPDFRMVEPSVLLHRRQLGSALAVCLHYLQQNDLDCATVDDELLPLLDAHQLFVADTGFRADPKGIELRLWPTCNEMTWGGTLDVIGTIERDPWLIDWKITEGAPCYAWAIQTQAYAMGLAAPRVPPFRYRRATVQLCRNGSYKFREWGDEGDRQEWLWALALVYRRLNRGEKIWEENR